MHVDHEWTLKKTLEPFKKINLRFLTGLIFLKKNYIMIS